MSGKSVYTIYRQLSSTQGRSVIGVLKHWLSLAQSSPRYKRLCYYFIKKEVKVIEKKQRSWLWRGLTARMNVEHTWNHLKVKNAIAAGSVWAVLQIAGRGGWRWRASVEASYAPSNIWQQAAWGLAQSEHSTGLQLQTNRGVTNKGFLGIQDLCFRIRRSGAP